MGGARRRGRRHLGRDWKHRSPFLIVYSNFPPIVDEHEALENFRTRLPNYPFFFLLSSNTLPLPSRERGSPQFKERQGPARAFDKSTSILQGPRARPSLLSPLPLFLDSTFAHLDLEKKISLSLSFSLFLSPQSSDTSSSALSMALAGRSHSDGFYGADSSEEAAAARYLERLSAPSPAGGGSGGGGGSAARGQGDVIAALRGAAAAAAAAAAADATGVTSSSLPSTSSHVQISNALYRANSLVEGCVVGEAFSFFRTEGVENFRRRKQALTLSSSLATWLPPLPPPPPPRKKINHAT